MGKAYTPNIKSDKGKNLTKYVAEFVKKNKTLTFMEFFFATLAKKNEMKISEVEEFKLRLCYECKEKNLFKLNINYNFAAFISTSS